MDLFTMPERTPAELLEAAERLVNYVAQQRRTRGDGSHYYHHNNDADTDLKLAEVCIRLALAKQEVQ